MAVREARILLTEDSDFSDLVYRDGAPPPTAILYLRGGPSAQPMLADRLLLVLENTAVDGHMVVIGPTNVRYRPLPGKNNDHA